LHSSFQKSEETDQFHFSSSSFQSQTSDYFENRCIKLCKRWNTVSVWWWECTSLDDLLQQKHDFRWNQLSYLWQEIADHYSLFQTLITWAEMYWITYSDIHWSSSFEDLHEKQTAESITSQLSEHSIKVQFSNHL